MPRPISLVLLTCACAAIASCGGGSALPAPGSLPARQAQHIVIIFQENRTVDNLFNGFPGADTVTTGQTSTGATVALQPVSLAAPYDLDHTHKGFLTEYNGGMMNGFDAEMIFPQPGVTPPPDAAYGLVPRSESAPYFALARQFAFADRMFQTNQGPSFPAHQFIISGTSIPATGSDLLASENVNVPPDTPKNSGCDSRAGSTVALFGPAGSEAHTQFPCFDHQTLFDLLDAKGMSWRYLYLECAERALGVSRRAKLRQRREQEPEGILRPPSLVCRSWSCSQLVRHDRTVS